MTERTQDTIPLGPSTRDTKGESYPRSHIPRDEAKGLAWMSWKSNGCEHGLKQHHINPDGTIQEMSDSKSVNTRQKPKEISSRQWRR